MLQEGETFSKEFKITEKVYTSFIEAFNDNNPMHTDDNYAIEKGFEKKIMHGNILGGFISHFIGECLPLKNVIIHCQEINYIKPVYINEPLLLELIVDEYFDSVKTIQFKFNFYKSQKLKIAKGKIQIGII